jgi:hypothetical protein
MSIVSTSEPWPIRKPLRTLGTAYGARLMLSNHDIELSEQVGLCCEVNSLEARATTLFTVKAGVVTGRVGMPMPRLA